MNTFAFSAYLKSGVCETMDNYLKGGVVEKMSRTTALNTSSSFPKL